MPACRRTLSPYIPAVVAEMCTWKGRGERGRDAVGACLSDCMPSGLAAMRQMSTVRSSSTSATRRLPAGEASSPAARPRPARSSSTYSFQRCVSCERGSCLSSSSEMLCGSPASWGNYRH